MNGLQNSTLPANTVRQDFSIYGECNQEPLSHYRSLVQTTEQELREAAARLSEVCTNAFAMIESETGGRTSISTDDSDSTDITLTCNSAVQIDTTMSQSKEGVHGRSKSPTAIQPLPAKSTISKQDLPRGSKTRTRSSGIIIQGRIIKSEPIKREVGSAIDVDKLMNWQDSQPSWAFADPEVRARRGQLTEKEKVQNGDHTVLPRKSSQ